MLVLNGLGTVASYNCSGGVCRATSPQQQALFVQLQRELNRVRPMFGLAADVAIDGVIGASTLAKLMKLATKFVGDRNSSRFDRVFDKYAIDSGTLPTTSMVAADALTVVQALGNNGLTEQTPATRDPATPADWTPAKLPAPTAYSFFHPQVVVGPTAVPGSNALPANVATVPVKMPKGVVMVGLVLGGLVVAGLTLGLLKRGSAGG